MLDVKDIPADVQDIRPDPASQITGRDSLGAKVLKRPGAIGRPKEVGINDAADVTAMPFVTEPRPGAEADCDTRECEQRRQRL